MTTKIHGELEIDHERGVIYFHDNNGICKLRICNLPRPIPMPNPQEDFIGRCLDITHLVGQDWLGEMKFSPSEILSTKSKSIH